jgi:hypothetical protein
VSTEEEKANNPDGSIDAYSNEDDSQESKEEKEKDKKAVEEARTNVIDTDKNVLGIVDAVEVLVMLTESKASSTKMNWTLTRKSKTNPKQTST